MVGVLDIPDSASKRIELPLKPMLGRVAVAPGGRGSVGRSVAGRLRRQHGCVGRGEGATVYLPVFHPGALFYFGDFHALQGDGEIVRIRPRIHGGCDVPVRPHQGQAHPLAADRGRRRTSWSPAASVR